MTKIRSAKPFDAIAVAEIYKPYVVETAISFELKPPRSREIEKRLSEVSKKFPWLVYEENQAILGYAYAGPWKNRSAYDRTAEVTVYVRQGHHGKGIGKSLYEELLKRLRAQGVVNVIGGIALPNASSVTLHESLGFKPVAHFKEVGFKFGKWWDVGYWQLQLPKTKRPTHISPLKKK